MNKIFPDYIKYTKHIDEYHNWSNDKNKKSSPNNVLCASDIDVMKKKAKTLTEPILLFDNYEHEKAEDSETFFQTYNIELMSLTSLICSLPVVATKLIPFLNRHADKHEIVSKSAELLQKYKDKTYNIAGKNVALTKIMTGVSAVLGGLFFVNGMKNSMKSQLGLIRKASFDASCERINNPVLYADLTEEQQKEVNSIIDYDKKTDSHLLNKLKDKVDIKSSIKSVQEYTHNKSSYEKSKAEYFKTIRQPLNNLVLTKEQEKNAKIEQQLLNGYVENVEHNVLEPLRKVETISNVSYSAMFTGGFLEYLITDKLVDLLKIKNKPLRAVMKIGVPLLTYFVLNKNISDIENKAILATKYKYLKQFSENPLGNTNEQKDKKQSLPEFIKTVYKDMKDYDNFSKNELPEIKKKFDAKKQIKLTKDQEAEAEMLQKNTAMILNNQRERVYEQTVGVKTLSEILLGPLDIVATALGAALGHVMSKRCPNKKIAGVLTGLGAAIAFIPAAIVEAKLTKQQKTAEKIAAMLAIKDMQDFKRFAKYDNAQNNNDRTKEIFKDFIK